MFSPTFFSWHFSTYGSLVYVCTYFCMFYWCREANNYFEIFLGKIGEKNTKYTLFCVLPPNFSNSTFQQTQAVYHIVVSMFFFRPSFHFAFTLISFRNRDPYVHWSYFIYAILTPGYAKTLMILMNRQT